MNRKMRLVTIVLGIMFVFSMQLSVFAVSYVETSGYTNGSPSRSTYAKCDGDNHDPYDDLHVTTTCEASGYIYVSGRLYYVASNNTTQYVACASNVNPGYSATATCSLQGTTAPDGNAFNCDSYHYVSTSNYGSWTTTLSDATGW